MVLEIVWLLSLVLCEYNLIKIVCSFDFFFFEQGSAKKKRGVGDS